MRASAPWLVGAVLLAILLPGIAVATGPTREESLALLRDPASAEARRRGVEGLAAAGTMADAPALIEALRDADAAVRAGAEQALWLVWSRSGDEEVDLLLALGIEQMEARQGEAAAETFTRVIQRRPAFAEGWNKRATVLYLMGEYRKSLADCDEVLARNPHHFGALSGYGLNYLRLGRPADALPYFERALAINPNLDQVRQTIEALRELLVQQRRGTI